MIRASTMIGLAIGGTAQIAAAQQVLPPVGVAPAPYSSLRYHYVPRVRLPLPPAVTIPPFDATVAKPKTVATSSLPDAGLPFGTRLGDRVSRRSETRVAKRLGGGADTPSLEAVAADPRDRLEEKRAQYDRPQ